MEGFVNDNGDPKPIATRCGWCHCNFKLQGIVPLIGKDTELYCDEYCEKTRERYIAMWVFTEKDL